MQQRHFFSDMLAARRFKVLGVTQDSIDLEAAWSKGLKKALQNYSRSSDAYNKTLEKCLAAVPSYSHAFENDLANPIGPPKDRYFSACKHFTDLVVDIDSPDNMLVFTIAKDIFEAVKAICIEIPKQFELTST